MWQSTSRVLLKVAPPPWFEALSHCIIPDPGAATSADGAGGVCSLIIIIAGHLTYRQYLSLALMRGPLIPRL